MIAKEKRRVESVIELARHYLNVTPVGVKFCFADNTIIGTRWYGEPLRYCEAVNRVMTSSVEMLLDGENISCHAAKEILGLVQCTQCLFSECLKELIEKNKFKNQESAFKALVSIPRLRKRPSSILLSNIRNSPDVYIFYLRPYEFMRVVQAYQRVMGEELEMDVSSVMPVCGNCTVRPYITNQICASFGCRDSREYGGLTEDKLVVGMPTRKAELIMHSLVEMGNNG